MNSKKKLSNIDYTVRSGGSGITEISLDDEIVGEIKKGEDSTFILTAKDGNRWILSPKIKGVIQPFSMTTEREVMDKSGNTKKVELLTIDHHLFQHKNNFYMINIAPEGVPMKEIILGKKYICRLNKPLSSQLSNIEHHDKSKLRWLRGIPVGELDGLGTDGHRVRLSNELEDIGLPLVASCHLMHSSE